MKKQLSLLYFINGSNQLYFSKILYYQTKLVDSAVNDKINSQAIKHANPRGNVEKKENCLKVAKVSQKSVE